MSLDDYSLSKSERIFFARAANIIYEWLSDEDKLEFNAELRSEGFFGIDDLTVKDRFFRLLNFLEVKYIRVERWIEKIHQCLEEINVASKNNTKIEDIEIKRLLDKSLTVSEVGEKFLQKEATEHFNRTLEKLGLKEGYERYITKLKMM